MSELDPDWDGYREAFRPRVTDKWKNLSGVSMKFEHPATPRMHLNQQNLLREELDRKLLSSNDGWACLLFIYRERKKVAHAWGPPKFSFQKFRRRGGFWCRHAIVNLPITAISEAYNFLGRALDFDEAEDDDEKGDGDDDEDGVAA